jgi:hypothetical protein
MADRQAPNTDRITAAYTLLQAHPTSPSKTSPDD